ncbi:MAG TPA: PhaM family polyhydroxyalkanoate granule multifunctional regulatory protein [Burkholderiales bacterium]|nr:PhaM family polyhydroxyalkanoate granule multifunctional regulatory protein [Burkholderiales bacterium]
MTDQSGKQNDAAATPFTAQEAMAFMQKMWNPFAMPMPGSAAGAVAPPEAASSAPAPQAQPDAMTAMMASVMPGMLPFPNPAAMFAALDPVEVERKIGELRIIEGWLAMSLNLMQMSIKTLELQKASLEALHAGHAPAKTKGESRSRKS